MTAGTITRGAGDGRDAAEYDEDGGTGEARRDTGDARPVAAAEADGQTQARWHGSISAALELITAPLSLPLASGCASWTLVYESERCSNCKQGRQRKNHNNKL